MQEISLMLPVCGVCVLLNLLVPRYFQIQGLIEDVLDQTSDAYIGSLHVLNLVGM
eukprot:SAG31_NODE_8307_length_1477_cov_1.320755_2_plen_55_part_00